MIIDNILRIVLFAAAILILKFAFAQNLEWISNYSNSGNSSSNQGLNLVTTGNGSIYGAGATAEGTMDLDGQLLTIQGDMDVLLTKLDPTGTAAWAINPGGSCPFGEMEIADGLLWDEVNGQLVMMGRFSSNTSFGAFTFSGSCVNNEQDLFIAAYDTAGTCLWAKWAQSFGFPFIPNGMHLGVNSEIHIYGSSSGTQNTTFYDSTNILVPAGGFWATYSSTGTLLSAERVILSGAVNGACVLGSDKCAVGYFNDNDSLWDLSVTSNSNVAQGFIARVNTNNSVLWNKAIEGTERIELSQVKVLDTDTVIATGFTWGGDVWLGSDSLHFPVGVFSGFIAAFEANTGDLLWWKRVEDPVYFRLYDLEIGTNGDIYLMGQCGSSVAVDGATFLTANASKEIYALRLDNTGNVIAGVHAGRAASTRGSMLVTDDAFYLSGAFDSTMTWESGVTVHPSFVGEKNLFIAKFDQLSGFTGTKNLNVHDGELVIYANPNNGVCTIDLPTNNLNPHGLILSVFDLQGAVIDRIEIAGSLEELELDIRAQPKGIYLVELQDGKSRYSGLIVFE